MRPEFSDTSKQLIEHLGQLPPKPDKPQQTYHVEGVASSLYFAYEQLRNSADYTQRHLLLRSAIERFLRRAIYLRKPDTDSAAEDLIIELTQSRYIKNDSVAPKTIREIRNVITQYTTFFETLHTIHNVPYAQLAPWIYQVMSVLIERLVAPQPATEAFATIAYQHYLQAVDRAPFKDVHEDDFTIALYCALHRTLLRSDQATARAYWILNHPDRSFVQQCQAIDTYFEHPLTNKIGRLLARYGAPMRTIRELFVTNRMEPQLLLDKKLVLDRAEAMIAEQYEQIRHATYASLWRMVAFVFITKTIIGLGIEVPYDLIVLHTLPVLPLILNLLFPPLYMMAGALSLTKPGRANTKAVLSYVERILYSTGQPLKYRFKKDRTSRTLHRWFAAIYTVLFLVPLAGVVWGLHALGFHYVDGIVFFVFLSAVGYLRFRLLQTSREMDIIDRPTTLWSAVGEFFHLPFATLGRWLSDRYQRLNLVAFILDIAIELPLKTTLGVLRQWVSFIRDKRDMM